MADDFDLRALIRATADEVGRTADLTLLAKEVVGRLDRSNYEAALVQALPSLVYDVLRRRGTSQADTATSHPRSEAQSRPVGGGVAPRPSRKVIGIRDAARQARAARLAERVSVGNGRTKLLGDCTAIDLRHAAAVRRSLAQANEAAAVNYERAASALEKSGVAVLRELPETVLDEHLGQAKAA